MSPYSMVSCIFVPVIGKLLFWSHHRATFRTVYNFFRIFQRVSRYRMHTASVCLTAGRRRQCRIFRTQIPRDADNLDNFLNKILGASPFRRVIHQNGIVIVPLKFVFLTLGDASLEYFELKYLETLVIWKVDFFIKVAYPVKSYPMPVSTKFYQQVCRINTSHNVIAVNVYHNQMLATQLSWKHRNPVLVQNHSIPQRHFAFCLLWE